MQTLPVLDSGPLPDIIPSRHPSVPAHAQHLSAHELFPTAFELRNAFPESFQSVVPPQSFFVPPQSFFVPPQPFFVQPRQFFVQPRQFFVQPRQPFVLLRLLSVLPQQPFVQP